MRSRSSGNNHGTGGLSLAGEAPRGDGGGGDGFGRGYSGRGYSFGYTLLGGYGGTFGYALRSLGGDGAGVPVGGFNDGWDGADGAGGAEDGPGPWE